MDVTVTLKCSHVDDAEDTLSGWRELPNFIFGYATEHQQKIEAVGLFTCSDGPLDRGQRKVVRWAQPQPPATKE